MIVHKKRAPVITCPQCEAPFQMTEAIIDEAVEHSFNAHPPARHSIEQPPVLYKCPHCATRSTREALMDGDVESFDARSDLSP